MGKTTLHWDLNTDTDLGGNNASDQEIASQKAIKTYTDNGLAEKQDILTAGTNISIVDVPTQYVDTRSTATIVTVGSARWQGVAYGNGVYVAVGNSGYTAYSSDGSTWSTPVKVGTNAWYSITFANGKFIAVGNSGYTTTTTDGVTWTTPVQVSGLSSRLQSVRYGNGVFCAVGWDGKSTTSTDGITWTTPVSISGSVTSYSTILYDGSKFVCPIRDGSYIYTSTDGVNWTSNTMSTSLAQQQSSIAYGNNTYVIGSEGGSNTGEVIYSTDLTNWSSTTQILYSVMSIYFDGTQFIAVGRRNATSTTYKCSTTTSTDGITWTTPVDIGSAGSSTNIQFGFVSITSDNNGKFVAVGDTGATTTFEISAGQEGGTFISAIVDSALSSTSENPVQNKVIYNLVGDIESALNTINSGSSS